MRNIKLARSILAICCLSSCAVFCAAQPKPDFRISVYANIEINPADVKKFAQDGGVYLGPPAIDIDDSGSIYLLDFLENAIEKYDRQGKRIWKNKNDNVILDIKTYGHSIFSFDGKKVYEYELDSAKAIDTFDIALEKEEITPVGNVSQFYGRYLFVNKEFVTENKKLLYVYDLRDKKISPKVPDGREFYPITNCKACSLSFVKELFEGNSKIFVNQTDEVVVYLSSDSTQEIKPKINIFNKTTGLTKVLKKIPFFKELSFTSIRCILLDSRNDLICCTLVQEKYIPKRLKFYRITLNNK
jgi:hypothetical protein